MSAAVSASLLSTLKFQFAPAPGAVISFISKVITPLRSTNGEASNGVPLPSGSVIKVSREIKPTTVGSPPITNSTTSPLSASETSAGVEPPQQSHAGQFGLKAPEKILRFLAIPSLGGTGTGALPSTRPSSKLS